MRPFSVLFPESIGVPTFPETADHLPDLKTAFQTQNTLSAWRYSEDQFILGASLPLSAQGSAAAKLYILRSGQDIVKEVRYFWQQILNLFLVMLGATVLISIYLAGLIARPLRQLTRTAALIRRKKTRAIEIPDLSARHDEIGELSLVMRDMTESLWNRLDSIEQFAADVAHELKNPLTSLKSALETLKIVKKKEDQKQLLDILQHDIERMDRLITDISLASRLDAELSREKHQALDLAPLLRKIIHRYQTHYGQDYKLALYLPDHTPLFVEASEERLTQVLDNLLDNALSFTPQHKSISLTAALKGSSIFITIDDDGPGISPAKLNAIFDRFYSERRGEEHFGKHSGLGLAICKQIIEATGGSIRAENKPSGGARFVITLMAADL
jgi:two-component system sensor histidine kinase ChvG